MSIEKKADATVYSVGETIQYTILVSQNTEGATATNAIVEDKDLTEGVDIDYASIQVDGAAVPEKDEVEMDADSIHLVRTDGGFKVVYPTLSGQSEITFNATITSEDLTGQKIAGTLQATDGSVSIELPFQCDGSTLQLFNTAGENLVKE